ncbi:MAG TPA: SPFH domain-containing protein [Polyangiaceae bacterium]
MGIIDFVKGGVREMMVARPDDMKHLIVYKHPDGNIPMYARLTVDLDESAVFFKSGSPPTVGALPPGRYPLSTENIPFLNHFITSFTGGNIFQAEVFFVKSQPIRNLTFGGQMMSMRDPELDVRVTPRAYGTYSMLVVDPIRFIIGYTGQAAEGDNEQITAWLRQRMFQGLGKTLAGFLQSGQTTFMDLGGVAPDLAAAMARDCPDFSDIGVRILEIGELKISVSPEDQARIDQLQDQMAQAKLKARMAKVGISQAEAEAQQRQFEIDQAGGYQSYAVGRAMVGAGEGMAKGGDGGGMAAIGAQMAVGMGMAGWMQHAAPAQPVAAPPAVGGKVTCPKCSAQVPTGKFCQECGGALAAAPAKRFCTACGNELGTAKFCSNCGGQAASA